MWHSDILAILACIVFAYTCRRVVAECGCPTDLPNTIIEYSELSVGNIANISCAEGYYSEVDVVVRVCQENGDWSSDIINCQEVCSNNELECVSGGCLPETSRCDGFSDCQDNSDEENCKMPEICFPGWYNFGYSCYFFGLDLMTFYEAINDCEVKGGYLAIVESDEESAGLLALVTTHVPLTDMIFIGGSDEIEEGVFRWYPSEKLTTYSNWYSGEPSNKENNQHCVALAWSWTGTVKWDDVRCDVQRFYICETYNRAI